MFDPRAAAGEYTVLGFESLPLLPGSKKAYSRGWQNRDSAQLWQGAPVDANIGLRAGGGLRAAFLDCDEKNHPGTFETAQAWLASLGYLPGDYPVITTATGGRHVYATFSGGLHGDVRILSPDFGAGEFRYGSGAYVVAPPSEVAGVVYSLIAGDYRQLPSLDLVDILPILKNRDATPPSTLPSTTTPPHISHMAGALLRGKGLERYASRSEAEQALLDSLVNCGHSFESILALFMSKPCAGKFAELREESQSRAIAWLKHSYDEALQWTQTHESEARRTALATLQRAESRPWPGRTGAVDKQVFKAHAQIAYQAGRLIYAASCRDLAERAEVNSPATASHATTRLISAGLLSLDTPSTMGECAALYSLKPAETRYANLYTPSQGGGGECTSLRIQDVFRWGGLGKSAGEVWEALTKHGALTVQELTARTGRGRDTVKRALSRMASLVDTVTGELLPMVKKLDGGKWRALENVDLELIAQVVGTAGAGERQKKRHAAERNAHHRALELGRRLES